MWESKMWLGHSRRAYGSLANSGSFRNTGTLCAQQSPDMCDPPISCIPGLTYSYISIYKPLMPRASTTSDAFNAVAEPRRREILEYLALEEQTVTAIVEGLRIEQPS